ncbi:hypothetical protein FJW04_13620 [Mesorhizobium sp. B2-7-3]|uniref:hypothetical protein n=1 Tax=Mesorhizobium sp. B2-7-3 TaxID=2589907 RepID=UPI00112D2CFE|nr:hypothetical protein [Mesorhizobium sp. B2-7-3]TPJ15916.1 hypothetical protein FJW04_13620 [Mesorhizobium sp. B2-7-3]
MSFCFDGESAVAAYRPCRERLADEGVFTPSPTSPSGETSAAALFDVADAGQVHRVDAGEADYPL